MKSQKEHWGRCRIASECVYAICKFLHLKGDFKINIIHQMHGDEMRQRGHAWVTRDGKDLFLTPAHRTHTMNIVGENDKYRYWVSAKQLRYVRAKSPPTTN